MTSTVVILTGPTASGKSALALKLAKRFPLEIVGADSLQVFRGLNIGTAKPSSEELAQVPHHLIDVLDPDQEANAFWYAREGLAAIAQIQAKGLLPLVVGGSTFYLQALEHPPRETSQAPRIHVEDWETAYAQLSQADPKAVEKIHPHDHYRIERAVALLAQGKLPSQEWQEAAAQPPKVQTRWLGTHMERSDLYERIDRRMEVMFAKGLLNETQRVLEAFPGSRTRLTKTIGYKEALAQLEGDLPEPEAMAKAQQATRNYAKRQMTWFRAESRLEWLRSSTALDRACEVLKEVSEA